MPKPIIIELPSDHYFGGTLVKQIFKKRKGHDFNE